MFVAVSRSLMKSPLCLSAFGFQTCFSTGWVAGHWRTESRPDSVVGAVEGISSIHKALCSVSKIPLGFEASIGLYLLQHGT